MTISAGPVPGTERVETCIECKAKVKTQLYVDRRGTFGRVYPPHARLNWGTTCKRSLRGALTNRNEAEVALMQQQMDLGCD